MGRCHRIASQRIAWSHAELAWHAGTRSHLPRARRRSGEVFPWNTIRHPDHVNGCTGDDYCFRRQVQTEAFMDRQKIQGTPFQPCITTRFAPRGPTINTGRSSMDRQANAKTCHLSVTLRMIDGCFRVSIYAHAHGVYLPSGA